MRRCLAGFLFLLLLGCAGIPQPTASDAVIVFIIPGMTSESGAYQPSYGLAHSVSLHDVSTAERKIVGIISTGQKLAYRARPGRYEFMSASFTSTDFMEANVAAGRTYYVVVQVQAGSIYNPRYGFRPVRAGDFESGLFRRWETNTSFVDRPEAWERWSKNNEKSIATRLQEFRPAWDQQGPAERRLRRLEVADGR